MNNNCCDKCGKKLTSYYAKHCWMCHRAIIKRKVQKCIVCGKKLSINTCVRCKKCHMIHVHECNKGKKHSKQHKQKIGEASLRLWKDKNFVRKTTRNRCKHLHIKPNKPEIILMEVLNKLFKNKYKYVGDGKYTIDRFNPDFINRKDRKIIELYGDYWHNLPSYIERDKRRKKSYHDAGYKLLIIWQHELQDRDLLIEKLNLFEQNTDV